MQFKSLHLENYQAYKNTEVNFTAGLNIVTGESDMGKSSILRALKKLVRDFPAGKDFINKDATSAKLTLTVVDDNAQEHIIVRQITPSKNLYFLDTQEFGGFGREIPEEIQNTLEMFLIELENNEKIDLYFSDQYDIPFMVTKGSAGTRSKLLGKIAGLHTLDRGIVSINKDTRSQNSILKTKSIDKDNLQKIVDDAIDTTKGHELCTVYDKQLQKIVGKLDEVMKLRDLQKTFSDIIDRGKKTKKFLDDFPKISVDFYKLREDIQRLNKFQKFYSILQSIDSQVVALPTVVVDVDIDFDKMNENIQKLRKLQKFYSILQSIDSQVDTLHGMEFDIDIKRAQKAWITMLTTLKICPLCKQSTVHIGGYNG